MLVLTLKPGKKVQVGDTSIIVLGVYPDRVKVGFIAPKHISIEALPGSTNVEAELEEERKKKRDANG